jgi:dynein heavy chain
LLLTDLLTRRLKDHQADFPEVELIVINPKSMTIDQLYGIMTFTLEWKDGILSKVVRDVTINQKPNVNHWIILDGPVDSLWIESMNTALDDNKLLCLTNGERIPIPPSVRWSI